MAPGARRSHNDYTVGWICALPLEMAAAKVMLDEIHEDLPVPSTDHNTYILGRIKEHNIVIACLPSGDYGLVSANTVAMQLLSSFRSIRFSLMVGIGGGVPNNVADIRLGDVVISRPTDIYGGVVQYDYGKALNGGRFQRTGTLDRPPQILLTALSKIQAHHLTEESHIADFIAEIKQKFPRHASRFARPTQEDILYLSDYDHIDSDSTTCNACDPTQIVMRPARDHNDPLIHYGLIASANQLVRDSQLRNRLSRELGVYCVEMEAAGLMNNYPCLVIRGICDYADSHKNKEWQGYASAVAAAYAKELLLCIPTSDIDRMRSAEDAISVRFNVPFDLTGLPAIENFLGRQKELERLWHHLQPQNSNSRTIMDGISAAASILQLAQMAGKTALEVYDFCSTIRDAPREISAISSDINALKILIHNLEGSLSSDAVQGVVNEDDEISDALWTLETPIRNCQDSLAHVKEKISPYLKTDDPAKGPDLTGKSAASQPQRSRFSRTNVLWYFKRKEIFGWVAELERTKSTFSEAMGSVTLLLTLKMHQPAKGKRALREDYEFNADLGSKLNDYTASVIDMKLNDSQSQISQTPTMTTNTPTARSDRDAALELKAVVSSGSVFLLKASLQYVQVDARDQKGRTALSYAAEWGKYDIAKVLLDEGANVSARAWSLSGWGDDHNPWFHCGTTPLWWAANSKHTDIADLLLRHGANPNSRTTSGRSPLQESCMWGDIDTAKLLLSKKADINAQNTNGWAPLHEAVSHQKLSCLQLLVNHGAFLDLALMQPAGKTALHIAVEHQRIDMVRLLLENGANPQPLMVEHVTPLHLAAAQGWILGIETLAKCRDIYLDPRDALLYETPLHKAARNRHVEVIDKLSALGANRKVKNVDGKTYEEVLEYSLADPGQWDVSCNLAWLSA